MAGLWTMQRGVRRMQCMCGKTMGRPWQAAGRDAEYFTSVVECAKTQIKYQENVHWPLNSIHPQPYCRVSHMGPSGGAAAWTIAVWG